jgi:hypothetical protein
MTRRSNRMKIENAINPMTPVAAGPPTEGDSKYQYTESGR